jgi:hypothetical protein
LPVVGAEAKLGGTPQAEVTAHDRAQPPAGCPEAGHGGFLRHLFAGEAGRIRFETEVHRRQLEVVGHLDPAEQHAGHSRVVDVTPEGRGQLLADPLDHPIRAPPLSHGAPGGDPT